MMKVVTALLVCGAAVSVVAWIVALLRENGMCPFAAVTRFVRGLPWGGRLVLLPLFAALVVYGSVKQSSELRVESLELGANQYWPCRGGESVEGGESVSNRVERVDRVEGGESGFNEMRQRSSASSGRFDEVEPEGHASVRETQSRGDVQSGGDLDNVANVEMLPIANTNPQLETGSTGNSQPPTLNSQLITPIICKDWLRFGGFEDWIYIGPGAWSFRYGSNLVERLAVFSSGKIRLLKQCGGDAWITLSAVPVSIAPAANWGMLCRSVESAERVDGDESGFNAENAEAQEAQRWDGGDFNRVERVEGSESVFNEMRQRSSASSGRFDEVEPEGHASVRETQSSGDAQRGEGGVGEESAMLNSANCSNLSSHASHLSHTSQGCEAHQILTSLITHHSSLFWHAETSLNTLVLTWQNALLNRRADLPVNIQAELFPAGEMRVTHDLSGEIVTEYLPAPELPSSDTLDEVMARIEGGNSNAYFYANVMAAKGPAVVSVHYDGASSLGDYSILAYPGVINSLPLLIGPKYKIECEAAFSHFSVSDDEVEVRHLSDRCSEVSWPVKISFEESGADNGNAFDIVVDPPFLEGIVVWNEQMMRSAGCRCCNLGTNGTVTVSADCACDSCEHKGRYEYEGHQEYFCFYHEREEDDADEPEEPGEPPEEHVASVSIRFDKSAVIFEDEYENAPGEFVPLRSTRTTLRCTAYGGERGGNLTVDLSGMGALRLVSGTPPTGRTIAPYETVDFEAEYEGETASSQEDATVAKAKFIENETNVTFDDDAKITVVGVKKMAVATVPSFRQRKDVGVGERLDISIYPRNIDATVTAENGKVSSDGLKGYVYLAPHTACYDKLSFLVRGVDFKISLVVIQPSGFAVKSITGVNNGTPNKAGMYSAFINYVPLPTNVSFYALQFMEVGMKATDAVGYFARPELDSLLDHSLWGAGDWFSMESYSDYFVDEIGVSGELEKPWDGGGSFTWPIPVIWRFYEETGVSNTICNIDQRFELDANGTSRVRKMGCTVERGTNQYFRAVIGL